jgi:hypothetical protein
LTGFSFIMSPQFAQYTKTINSLLNFNPERLNSPSLEQRIPYQSGSYKHALPT